MHHSENKNTIFSAVVIMTLLVMIISSAIAETATPVITAKVNGTVLDTNVSNQVTLPATVFLTSNKPVTIYYTTNGKDPLTSTTYAKITSANTTVSGPTITDTYYMLLLQGVDKSGNLTDLMVYTFISH